jgi:long-chain acyl-CoA synthetase
MGSNDCRTLNELFLKALERHRKPDVFLVKSGGQYRSISAEEVLRQVVALAHALERRGLGRGDRLALLAENRLEWTLTDYATMGLGAIDVPIYPTLLEPDIEFILHDSGSKGVVVSSETQLRKVLSVRSRLPELKFVLVMDHGAAVGTGVEDWHEVVSSESELTPGAVDAFRQGALGIGPKETATLLYTSGTTGQYKGVLLTHANIVSNVKACQDLFPLGSDDVAVSFLPLSHILERMLDYTYFWLGASIAYGENLAALPQNMLEVRPTVMGTVPRVLEKIREQVMDAVRQASPVNQRLFRWAVSVGRQYFPHGLAKRTPPLTLRWKHALAEALIYSRIRAQMGGRLRFMISGAAPLSRELAEFFHAMGLPVYEGYGLTETSPVIAVNCPRAVKLGTVGRVIPGVEVKLGEESEDQDSGTGREIQVRGPNVTPGYFQQEDANREAFVGGWFCTGDLGTLDAEGYLSITGRKKSLFKTSGGKYVSPDKLENLFQGHPYVAQILVLGNARRFVSALIVPNFAGLEAHARREGIEFESREDLVANPTIQALMARQVEEATQWLAPHEKIRQFTLLATEFTIGSGELTPTQKTRRRVVEAHYRNVIERMYEPGAGASQKS